MKKFVKFRESFLNSFGAPIAALIITSLICMGIFFDGVDVTTSMHIAVGSFLLAMIAALFYIACYLSEIYDEYQFAKENKARIARMSR